MSRPRHPDKDLEAILKEAEDKKWRIEKRRKYYMMFCPCKRHKKTVHLTPSGPNYMRDLLAQLGRATCWNEKPEGEGST
jgi:hypothetical protein